MEPLRDKAHFVHGKDELAASLRSLQRAEPSDVHGAEYDGDELRVRADYVTGEPVTGVAVGRPVRVLMRGVVQDGLLRRIGYPPAWAVEDVFERRITNPPQVTNLHYKAFGALLLFAAAIASGRAEVIV